MFDDESQMELEVRVGLVMPVPVPVSGLACESQAGGKTMLGRASGRMGI